MKPLTKFVLSLATLLPMIATADELPNSAFKELVNIRAMHLNNASSDNRDSYYFLYGLAFTNDDLVTTGRAFFQSELENNKHELTYEEVISRRQKLGFEKLDLSQSNHQANLFCRLDKDDCIKTLFDNQKDWQATTQKYKKLLNRYQQFLNRKPAVTEHLLTSHSPIPEYQFLLKAQRLMHLSYLSDENKLAVTNKLQKELEILKNQLKLADNLIQKMVIRRMIVDNLQMTVLLKIRYDINANTPILHLSTDEKSLRLPISYEFLSQEQDMKYIETKEFYNEIAKYMLSQSTPSEKNAIETGNYQHNKTYNAIANYLLNQIELSEKNAIEVGKYQRNNNKIEYPIKVDKQNNELGFMLANIAVVDYGQYAQRLNEIDNIINMTNYIMTGNDKYLINVFTGDNKGIVRDDEKVCIPLPKADNEQTHTCVYL